MYGIALASGYQECSTHIADKAQRKESQKASHLYGKTTGAVRSRSLHY